MWIETLSISAAAAFCTSLFACSGLRRYALRHALLDMPNDRSLHEAPVPRLGGVAVALGVWIGIALAILLSGHPSLQGVGAWAVGSACIAALGLLDDLRSLPVVLRLIFQCAICAGFLIAVGLPSRVQLANQFALDLPTPIVGVLALVWMIGVLNIYNFMDGMDGLAAVQAISASAALSAALVLLGHAGYALIPIVLAAASSAFFVHNAPPANMFLGDAGSTLIGFTLASIPFLVMRASRPAPFLVVPIALSPFLLDGTFTIFRRLLRGEKVWRAHRSHLYQRAVQAGRSHREVLVVYAGWAAVAAGGAVLVAAHGRRVAWAVSVASLLVLASVWRWVVQCELKSDRAAARTVQKSQQAR